MSISRDIDEYMEQRGIEVDDTVVADNPCAEFDGKEAGEQAELAAEKRIAEAESALRDLLG